MSRILALWLPNWPVQRLVRDQPELTGRALVLYEQDARHGQRVKACSAAAEQQAVRPGMPLAEAQTLLAGPAKEEKGPVAGRPAVGGVGGVGRPSPNASGKPAPSGSPASDAAQTLLADAPLFVCHDARRDREALVELAEWCEQFSPIVGLDQTDEPDSLLMDVSGLAHLFGGEEALAQAVVTACQQQRLTVRVAIADTASAAWGLARWSEMLAEESSRHTPCAVRQHSASGTDGTRSVPATFVVLPPEEAETGTVLDHLPVEVLRLPPRATEQLHRLGIRRIEQLNRLPRASLAARFGDAVIERLDRLTGTVAEPIVAHHAREPLSVRWCFEHPTTHHETIEHVLGELLAQLSRRLLEQGQGVLRLTCQLVCRNRPPLSIDISLFRPTIAPQHLLALAKLQLALLTLPEAVEEIRVRALTTAPREQRQGELFGDAPRDQPTQLALLVERLSNRLGREQVVRAELQAESQPELAYRYRPLAGEAATPQPAALASPPSGMRVPGPLLRPLRLFDPPQSIEVVGIALDGPPAMFHYQRRRHRVARCFGPERIETGWWRGESCRRDYYRVETEEGSRWWLFRRLQDQRWFLQGTFE
jgi:protein ImuB